MAKVNICNVEVKNNPCMFKEKFQFEITFDCIENLKEGMYKADCLFYKISKFSAVT